ncbi:major facilitator superfamily domain-containing protein [Ditylenchus destructor]|uniref:Major facilitator superfamily domain-containing protein n=1 Tax=Ditylenchus destructor TaxID=166010 RepID=A0AAD4RAI8_9BILA|nr:major facilitator superfamily domain-containing protein [Ditylenchus destructor]
MIDYVRVSTIGANAWPYLNSLDSDATEAFFGYAKSAGSIGNMISATVAGFLSNWIAHTRPAMVVGKLFSLLACILYVSLELFPYGRRYIFLLVELLFGIATGFVGVWRVHVVMASTEKDRARAVSMAGLAITLGLSAGPLFTLVLGLLMDSADEDLMTLPNYLQVNIYTAPGYLTAAGSIIGLLLLMCCFDGRMDHIHTSDSCKMLTTSHDKPVFKIMNPTKHTSFQKFASPRFSYDCFAVFVCLLMKIGIVSALQYTLTLSAPYTSIVFKWSHHQTVFFHALAHGLMGLVGVVCNLGYIFGIFTKIPQRKAVLFAITIMFLFFLITYPWPFISETIPYKVIGNTTQDNGTVVEEVISYGCKPSFRWCKNTPAVDIYVYHIALVICMGIAIPLSNTNLDVLYSKILGPIKQGTMQGMFAAVGDVVNVFAPIAVSQVYTFFGPRPVWIYELGVLGICIVVWCFGYSRIVPFKRKNSTIVQTSTIIVSSKLA